MQIVWVFDLADEERARPIPQPLQKQIGDQTAFVFPGNHRALLPLAVVIGHNLFANGLVDARGYLDGMAHRAW